MRRCPRCDHMMAGPICSCQYIDITVFHTEILADKILRITNGLDILDWRAGSGNTIEIFDILVKSGRRNGVGRAMIKQLIANVSPGTKLWAITRSNNEIAQEFYEALGFRVVGVLREFYQDEQGVDAVMYGLRVP